MNNVLKGKAWTFGANINAESIMPTGTDLDPARAATMCLVHYDPEFHKKVQPGDMVVAGPNFGNSSSRSAGRVFKHLNVSVIICETSARIFFRNTWNIGVPVLECPDITSIVNKGDELEVDLETGEIKNLTTGAAARAAPTIPLLVDRWRAGGMIEWVKQNRDKYDTIEMD